MPPRKSAIVDPESVFLSKTIDMQIVLILHNLLRWVVLLAGIWTVLNALTGRFGNRAYTASDNRSNPAAKA